jgi:mannosyltransferase OCH1-like enzyme
MIEKNIFQTWFTRDLHPLIQNKIDSIKALNPTYIHLIYTDNEMDEFVNINFAGEIAHYYNKLNIIVAKVDFWRYLVLYKYGGVYLDMDSSINRPLDELIKDTDQAIITAEGNPEKYVQWALIFQKGHPILKKTIELIVENIKYNKYPNDILKMTGPVVYSEAINIVHKDLYGSPFQHSTINNNTDITFSNYRIYGKDYNGFFSFKYPEADLLYINKKHWREEQEEKSLMK